MSRRRSLGSQIAESVSRYALGETTEDDFQNLLDANPDDHQTRGVFADWLQERGDPRAEGYRALGAMGAIPYMPKAIANYEGGYSREDNDFAKSKAPNAILPNDWYHEIASTSSPVSNWWTHTVANAAVRSNRRQVEDAAAHAFSQLPPERRQEILNGPHQMARNPKDQKSEELEAGPVIAPSAHDVASASEAQTRRTGDDRGEEPEPPARKIKPELYKRIASQVRRYAQDYTHADFHRRILENPKDTTPALVYADWLQENGHEEAASIIRAHVRQNKTGADVSKYTGGEGAQFSVIGSRSVGPGGTIFLGQRSGFAHPLTGDRGFGGLEWRARVKSPEVGRRLANALFAKGARSYPVSEWHPPETTEPTPESPVPMSRIVNSVRRYAMNENLATGQPGHDEQQTAGGLSHQVIQEGHGGMSTLAILADKLQDNEHPAANLMYRLVNGEGKELNHHDYGNQYGGVSPYESSSVFSSAAEERPFPSGQRHYIILPAMGKSSAALDPNTSHVSVDYLNHPSGHHFMVNFYNDDGTIGRRFLLPTNPDEVREYAKPYLGSRSAFDRDKGERVMRALALAPGKHETVNPYKKGKLSRLASQVRRYAEGGGEKGHGQTSRNNWPESDKDSAPPAPEGWDYAPGGPEEPDEPEPEEPEGPEEGDYLIRTFPSRHEVWQNGHRVMTFAPTNEEGIAARIREHSDNEQYWPNAWHVNTGGHEAIHYAAWRAPAGGMIARGTFFKGGSFVNDMQGEFMNPPKTKPKRKTLAEMRAAYAAAQINRKMK